MRSLLAAIIMLLSFAGICQTGPGGVGSTSSTTTYWYDAEVAGAVYANNDKVPGWANIGSNGDAAFVSTIGKQPTYRDNPTDNINGYPVLQFNGSFLQIPDHSDINLSQVEDRTITIVFKTGNGGGRQVLYEEGGTTRGINAYIRSNRLYVGAYNTVNDGPGSPWGYSYFFTGVSSGTTNILTIVLDGDPGGSGTLICYLNGVVFGTASNIGVVYPHPEDCGIGAKLQDTHTDKGPSTGTGDFFNGYVAEMIISDFVVSFTQRIILENYLSARYGLSLGLADYYSMDDPGNGDYDHDVVGIGQTLLGSHTNSIGQGLMRLSNPSSLSSGDFLFVGHDNSSTCSDADVPASLNARLSRSWRASHTGNLGTVDIEVDLSSISAPNGSDLRLLLDADGVFSNATVIAPSSSSGQTATFSSIAITDGMYIGIAAVNGAFGEPPSEITRWLGGTSTDWSDANNWSNGVPTSIVSAEIPAGTAFSPIVSGDGIECYSLIVAAGATFTIQGTDTLDVYGSFVSEGTFVFNQSTINLVGGCGLQEVSIQGAGTSEFYNIRQKNLWGGEINGNQIDLHNALMIERGNFFTGDSLRLISNATNTARITEVKNGDLSGEILMERYVDAGATNWRFICYPVSGADLEQLDDDFVTAGFPGTDWPTWPSPSNLWPSMYRYDETAGVLIGDGYYPPSSTSDIPAAGEGIWVWCGDSLSGTQPFTIDISGEVNSGDINYGVTYTPAAGTYEDDGWNMVGNPYPCTIDWDDPDWTKTNVDGAIYIWNPDLQQYASYVGGIGTNGGSRYIASSQAFWIRTNAASPNLTAREGVKVNQDQGFIKSIGVPDALRLSLEHPDNNDEIVIRFSHLASDSFDLQLDAQKFDAYNANLAKLSSKIGSVEYSVNSMAMPQEESSVPIELSVPSAASCTIRATDLSAGDQFSCIFLEDIQEGVWTDLKQDSAYTFTASQGVLSGRFVLHFTPKPALETVATTCSHTTDGIVTIQPGLSGNYSVSWVEASTNLGGSANNLQGIHQILGLSPGQYVVNVLGGMCGVQSDTVYISSATSISTSEEITAESCQGCCDASVEISASGGTPPYTIEWDHNGSNQWLQTQLCTGTMSYVITDANGCLETGTAIMNGVLGDGQMDAFSLRTKVYPNPVSDVLMIETVEPRVFEFYDYTGQLIAVFKVDSHLAFAVNSYPSGIYLLRSEYETIRVIIK